MQSYRPEFKVYKIKDSYEEFLKARKEIPLDVRKKVNFEMYKKIISKFLFIYVNEVLFMGRTYYFFLTGKLMLNKCGNWIRKDTSNYKVGQENKLKKTNSNIGFFWYERPIRPLMYTRLKKNNGSSNPLPILQKEYLSKNNVDRLKTTKELKKEKKFVLLKEIIIKRQDNEK